MDIAGTAEVVGRDEELAAIERFLAEGPSPACALVLEGEAGIGKTTLWLAATERAAAHSYLVLGARPAETDEQLSFAGVADLLTGVLNDLLAELPSPQRTALEVALMLADRPDPPPDRGTIAFAFLNALRALARAGPVALAIDDVQWLDRPSAQLVQFAAQRLDAEPIRMLIAKRDDGRGRAPLELERAFPNRVKRLSVGPLSLGALHELLRTRLGISFARPTLRQLHEVSGGNPFYALEIGRTLERLGGRVAPGHALPLPGDLEELLGNRLSSLPPATEEALLVAAVSSDTTLELLQSVLGRSPELQAAIDARVIELTGDRVVRFIHPLFATAIQQHAGQERTRQLHLTLAEHVRSPEERALHLALGAIAGDEQAARELVVAARAARARGAPIAAATFFDHALRLSRSTHPGRVTWESEHAETVFEAGDAARATELLTRLGEQLPPGRARAGVLWRLATVMHSSVGVAIAEWLAVAEQALQEAGDDSALAAAIHTEIAWASLFVNDLEQALGHARTAVELAERLDDAEIGAHACATRVYMEVTAGIPPPGELVEQALWLEQSAKHVSIENSPSLICGFRLLLAGDLAAARSHIGKAERLARERGDEIGLAVACGTSAVLETLAGDWSRAETYARETVELSEHTGVNLHESQYARALLDAHLGRVEPAVAVAEQLVADAERGRSLLYLVRSLSVLGFLELSRGDMRAARVALGRAAEAAETLGLRDPGLLRCIPDCAEALVALGELVDAERITERFGRQAAALGRGWALATADRCRGLILAARDDPVAAVAALERACAVHRESELPFELGRTLLALGSVQRRARQRRAARESLQEAHDIFERLGARLWAEKGRSELGRIAGRTPAGQNLTPTEQRIAELVARGLTNREVAAELVVAVHSVESALTRIYGKLSVRSRTELARRFESDRSP